MHNEEVPQENTTALQKRPILSIWRAMQEEAKDESGTKEDQQGENREAA